MKLTSSCYQIIQILKPIRRVLKKWDNLFPFSMFREFMKHVLIRLKTIVESNRTKFRTSGMLRDWRQKVPTGIQRQRQKRTFQMLISQVGHKIPDWIKCVNINIQIKSLFLGQRKCWKKERAGKERVRKESSSRSKERQKSGGQGRRLYVLYSERTNCKI